MSEPRPYGRDRTQNRRIKGAASAPEIGRRLAGKEGNSAYRKSEEQNRKIESRGKERVKRGIDQERLDERGQRD